MIIFNGSTGGLGRYLRGLLCARGIPHYAVQSRLENPEGLRDELERLMSDPHVALNPILFIPMAALVSVPLCESDPNRAYQTNVTDTLQTLKTFIQWADAIPGAKVRVLYVSTGHLYAPKKKGERTNEMDPIDPRSVYAKTKWEAEKQLRALVVSSGSFDYRIARVFGLLSPEQPSNYLLPGLIRRVRERNVQSIPGLEYVRDYLDARDVCRLITDYGTVPWPQEEDPVVNICSGEPTVIREILDEIIRLTCSEPEELIKSATPGPGRTDDIPWLVGDPTKVQKLIRSSLKSIPLRQTIQDSLKHASMISA